MRNISRRSLSVAAAASLLLVVGAFVTRDARARNDSYPAHALADLAMGIARCSVHPCLGDDEEGVTEFLLGRILENDCDEFSDLRVAYPGAAASLKGIVVWSLDDELDDIYLHLTGFHAPGSIVMNELVRAHADCTIEEEGEEDAPSLLVFECDLDDEDGTTIEAAFAPGLASINIY